MSVTVLPFKGAESTANLVIKIAVDAQFSPIVRQLAESIIKDVKEKDYISEHLAILRYVEANTRYTRDPATAEQVKDPVMVIDQLNNGQRPLLDCDDMVALLLTLLISIGAKCQVVICALRHLFHLGQRQYTHIYLTALDPNTGKYVVLDPVANSKTHEMLTRIVACKVWDV